MLITYGCASAGYPRASKPPSVVDVSVKKPLIKVLNQAPQVALIRCRLKSPRRRRKAPSPIWELVSASAHSLAGILGSHLAAAMET